MTKKQRDRVNFVRKNGYGYIGESKIVSEATDQELLTMIDLQDAYAKAYNTAMEFKTQFYNIYESIELRLW